MIYFRDVSTAHLVIDTWEINPSQCWAVIGRNGSGKKELGQLLGGVLGDVRGEYQVFPSETRILSYESQQAFYEHELKIDDTDYLDHLDPGTIVSEILGLDQVPTELSFLKLQPLMDRGYRLLSSGESRKVLLAKLLLEKPRLLILDEPYDLSLIHI